MNNETQPTPEQLAKWREEAQAIWDSDDYLLSDNCHPLTAFIHAYLRAKQENEKLNTVAINLIAASEEREGDDGERCYLVPAQEFDDLQELLND